jgi:TetR/AcrR family transcriptional regulator
MQPATTTSDRILSAAIGSFGTRGYEATSLDALAATLGLRKQTILYWFPSKEALLAAAVDRAADELASALERSLARAPSGWPRVEAIVKSVFRLSVRRPELLGVVREVSRLGPPASTRLLHAFGPLMERATAFLEEEMAAGHMRPQEPRLVLLAAYSAVIGMATEVEVLRALGFEPTARELVRRRNELLSFLGSALGVEPARSAGPAPA